jgi:DHA1 family inner membrane transport protein
LLSLVVSNFATGVLPLLVSLLLLDIGNTFKTSVGVTSQMNTVYSIIAVLFALLTGALSIRFKHKSLLLVGLMLATLSALGCALASNFPMMLAFYAVGGAGYVMVSPMSIALVGEHLELEKRANAVGWIVGGGALVYFLGPPIALAASFGSWHFSVLAFVVPVLLTSLVLVRIGLRYVGTDFRSHSISLRTYFGSFKQVLSNRSAFSCLIGDFFRSGSFVVIVVYAASFGRQIFSQSREIASIIILAAAFFYVMGSLISSRIIKRRGRKDTTVLATLLAGGLGGSYMFMSYEAVYLPLVFAASLFFGIVASSANSLSLEQVPTLKGTMMSIDYAAINLGSAFGTAIAGTILLAFNYEVLGAVLGLMGIMSAFVFLLFAKDPTKKST